MHASRGRTLKGSYWKCRMALRCVILLISSSGTSARYFMHASGDVGQVRVRVRVVALPRDVVDVEVLAAVDAEGVVDEARDDAVLEDLAREHVAEVLARPLVVVLVDVVDPLERSRGSSRCRPRRARSGASVYLRRMGDHSRSAAACTMFMGWRLIMTSIGASARGHDELRRGAQVHADDGALVGAGLSRTGPNGPSAATGQPELLGVLRERHRVTALRRPRGAPRRPSTQGPRWRGCESGMKRPGSAPHHWSMCQSL